MDAGTAGSLGFIDLKLDWHGETTSMCRDGLPDLTNRQRIGETCISCCPESLHSVSPIYRLIVFALNPITLYRQNKIGIVKGGQRTGRLTERKRSPSCILKQNFSNLLGYDV